MHEHLPVGCQSLDSIVDIRNKLEINYLRRRGSGSHAARSGRKPDTGKRSSWCCWIQPCKLVFQLGLLSFYNRSGCVCKILRYPWVIWVEGWSDSRYTHALFSINPCSASQHLSSHYSSWLPGLLVRWCWNTPTLMASDNQQLCGITGPISPSRAEQIWGADASSSNCAPSLSGQDSWQLQFLERQREENGLGLATGERGLWGCANMSRWSHSPASHNTTTQIHFETE